MTSQRLHQQLLDIGVGQRDAETASTLFETTVEALRYLGHNPHAAPGYRTQLSWKEYWSLKYSRFYYCEKETGESTWDIPPTVQYQEWLLDASMYGVQPAQSRRIMDSLIKLCTFNWEIPQQVEQCLALISRILSNIAQCGNSVAKYRAIKLDNAKFQDKVAGLMYGRDVLTAAGFRHEGSALAFPAEGDLALLKCAAAKVAQLLEHKGFTGQASEVDDGSSGGTSKWSGQPGFRYQQVVHECSLCSHPINDGSERLWTGRHEAPHGEYRFECGTCQGFNLCQSCWDKHQAQLQQGGPGLHDAAHVFEHHGPQMSRHGASASRQATANNPWGNAFTGGSVGRARERLKERTGM